MTSKTVLLGFGAQKAGTTWLSRYLRAHPEVAQGPYKELAVLTNYFAPEATSARRAQKSERLAAALEKRAALLRQGRLTPADEAAFRSYLDYFLADFDLDDYAGYLGGLLDRAPRAHVVSDITPAYCSLTAEQMHASRDALQRHGFRVKACFLMRDPLERCYSGIRMAARRKLKKTGTRSDPTVSFAKNAIAEWSQVRTRYERIVPRIEMVFPPEDRFIGFYETLFAEPSIERFCAFLGIAVRPAAYESKVNSSPRDAEPDMADRIAVRRAYEETYAYCAERYGTEFIAGIWPNYRLVD